MKNSMILCKPYGGTIWLVRVFYSHGDGMRAYVCRVFYTIKKF